MIDISIVVCTYKRYDLVRNCLSYLERLNNRQILNLEIIVVENTPKSIRENMNWISNFSKVRLVVENETGLSVARNAGVRLSSGGIVIFLDDDAEVHTDWLDNILTAFRENPSAQMIGGKVLPKYVLMDKPLWVSKKCEELLSCINWGESTRVLKDSEWVAGANLAYRRQVFESYGLFSTNLGRKGEGTLLSNEESEFNSRIPASTKFYCGQAVVDHIIAPERLEPQWFRKRIFWQAISDVISGAVMKDERDWHFTGYINGLLSVPAEYRTAKSLFYECKNPEEFDHQLNQIYRQSIALSIGGGSWESLVS
jgi:hypothetical protein